MFESKIYEFLVLTELPNHNWKSSLPLGINTDRPLKDILKDLSRHGWLIVHTQLNTSPCEVWLQKEK